MEQRIFDLLRNQRMLLIVLVIAGGHFVWMMDFFEPAISSPDANGYFAQAQLIATEGRTWFSPESLLQYVGGHWIDTGDFLVGILRGCQLLLRCFLLWRVTRLRFW